MGCTGRFRYSLIMPQIIAIVMLFLALVPIMPYAYYMVLRLVLFGVCAYLAYQAYQSRLRVLTWFLAGTALLYNPFLRVHLTRTLWSFINILTIILLIASIWAFRTSKCYDAKEGHHES